MFVLPKHPVQGSIRAIRHLAAGNAHFPVHLDDLVPVREGQDDRITFPAKELNQVALHFGLGAIVIVGTHKDLVRIKTGLLVEPADGVGPGPLGPGGDTNELKEGLIAAVDGAKEIGDRSDDFVVLDALVELVPVLLLPLQVLDAPAHVGERAVDVENDGWFSHLDSPLTKSGSGHRATTPDKLNAHRFENLFREKVTEGQKRKNGGTGEKSPAGPGR